MCDLAHLRRGVTAILLMMALAVPAAAIAPPPEKQKWTRVRLDGYEVFTNLGERRTKEVASSVQRMTSTVARAVGPQRRSPVRIFVFAKSSQFREYRDALIGPGTEMTGISTRRLDATFIILDGSSASSTATLNSELAHLLFAEVEIPLPFWVSHGLAGFYETVEISGDHVRIGRAHPEYVEALRSSAPLPTREMLQVTWNSDAFRSGPDMRRISAQAWAMAHLLIVGGETPPLAIRDMLRNIENGDKAEDAFVKSVGMTLDQFDAALRVYVRRPTFRYVEFDVKREETAVLTADRLEQGRLIAELAELLMTGRRYEDARLFIDAALASNANNPRAHSARGYDLLEQGKFDEARAAFAKAQELDPSDKAIVAAVKRFEPQERFGGRSPAGWTEATVRPERRDESARPTELNALNHTETMRRAMAEATPEERVLLAASLESSRKSAEARKRYEEAIALANAQKIDESLKLLKAIADDPEVGQPLRDAASIIYADILKQSGRTK